MEEEIIALIEERGPLTGAELLGSISDDSLLLWRACRLSRDLAIRKVGRRYLRLDRRVDGFARLSPSILREFLTYSVIGLSNAPDPLERKAAQILARIEEVSSAKLEIAYSIASSMESRLGNELSIKDQVCFIIAGDIVFNMAHDVPRPERSTGKLVKGSDMDMVVIADDLCPSRLIERLDEEIYREKYSLLINPFVMEEIDYVVKKLDRVREQMRFDTFTHMVACKILTEGAFLYGSEGLFHTVKSLLKENLVIEKIEALEKKARLIREEAEIYLSKEDPRKIREDNLYLFYPIEESEEFE